MRDDDGDLVMYVKHLPLCLLLIAATNLVQAQEPGNVHPSLTEKFIVDMGVYFPDRTFEIHVDGSGAGGNPSIVFEDEFGLNRSDDTFAIDFGWRFGKKWSLLAQYFESSGSRSAVLDEDIEWNDVVFGEGSNAAAGQEFSMVRVFFGRQFETSERHDFGIGAGFHWLEVGAFIEGDILVSGAPSEFRREAVKAEFPLPNVGIWYRYSPSRKWAFKGRFDYLYAKIGDYDGSLVNAGLGINYQIFEHFGLGLNYNVFELDLGMNRNDWRGEVKTRYSGPFVYVSASW